MRGTLESSIPTAQSPIQTGVSKVNYFENIEEERASAVGETAGCDFPA
jgi:hypothetical protein